MNKKEPSTRYLAMVKKHGSPEAVSKFMRAIAEKSARNKVGTGGFAYMKEHDPERLSEVARTGGKNGSKSEKD